MLLITGIMMGYITSSAISLLNFLASVENIQSFVLWGMGSFNSVSLQHLPLFSVLCVSGLILALLLTKPLNAMLLGESYAANLGVNMQLVRNRCRYSLLWPSNLPGTRHTPCGFSAARHQQSPLPSAGNNADGRTPCAPLQPSLQSPFRHCPASQRHHSLAGRTSHPLYHHAEKSIVPHSCAFWVSAETILGESL